MSPFIAYHATVRRYRDSIRYLGLLAGIPDGTQRPYGVYVFSETDGHPIRTRGGPVYWSWGFSQDVWQVAYIGPLSEDRFVNNGYILHECVPPQHLTLITHITPEFYV